MSAQPPVTQRRWHSLGALLACLWVACGSGDGTVARTEVLLQVDADALIRARADRLSIELASGAPGAQTLTEIDPEFFDLKQADFHWPASLALIARANHEDHVFQATIVAEANGSPLARGRVRSAFLKGKTLLLTTSLFGECIDMFSCDDDQTCVALGGEARCVSAVVDAKQLASFIPGRDAGMPAADSGSPVTRVDAATMPNPRPDAGKPSVDSGGMQPSHLDAAKPLEAGTDAAPSDGGTDSGSDASSCTPNGAEQCYNGVDDDCNGKVDCADSACTPAALCAPSGSMQGVLVDDGEPCPSGFTQSEVQVQQGILDNGCAGCSCASTATTCTPRVWYYATQNACMTDMQVPYSGGTLLNPAPIASQALCMSSSPSPIGDSQGMSTPAAWRVTMDVYPGTCSASGNATPLPPSWMTQKKLCTRAASGGGGCSSGLSCVPKISGKQACAQKPTTNACPGGTNLQTWQRGFSDNRSCGLCSCTASGGDCNNVAVNLGHDWSCGTIDDTLHGGEKHCSVNTYSPPAFVSGQPTNPTCSASAVVNGALTATSPLDLCCTP